MSEPERSQARNAEPRGEPAAPPPRIPGYRIEGLLGRGSTGVVYRAVQLAVERPVALKVLHSHLVGTRRAERRLQREARTAARLAHPSIIGAIDLGEVDGRWWYAMELVVGESLAARIERGGRLKEREALRLFVPLCDALLHAHRAGVVHRDIKPANVLIDERGLARLVDLGLAVAEDDPSLTRTGGTLGTPCYISPEQARDPSSADSRSDLWSLGATMFHALCGEPPFRGDSVAEILSEVLYARIPDPRSLAPHLSKGMALVLRKCLTNDPNRRYQDPAELARDLERLRERRTPDVVASSLDPVEPAGPDWRRILRTGAGVALFVTVAWLLAVRPWLGPGSGREADREGGWPAVERIAGEFELGRMTHRRALVELAAMELPEPYDVERSRVETAVRADLDRRVDSLLDAAEREMAERLAARELASAEARVGSELRAELAEATGYARLDALPEGPRESALERQAAFAARAAAARDAVVKAAEDRLAAYYEENVRPQVQSLAQERRWRDALALLETPTERWLADAAVDLQGLTEVERRGLGDSLEIERHAARSSLRTSAASIDGDLLRWIERREEALRTEVAAGTVSDAAARLDAEFWVELERRGIDLEQFPSAWGPTAVGRLGRAEDDLAAREARRLADEASAGLVLDRARGAALCARRAYRAAIDFWRERLDDPRTHPVRADIELHLHECRRLAELLERASEGVLARDGQTLELWFDTILEQGRVDAGADPLRRGFELAGARRTLAVHLVRPPTGPRAAHVVRSRDLEILAGLGPAELAPEDLLLRACFRDYEGRPEEALETLPLDARGLGEADARLLSVVRTRVLDELNRRAQRVEVRQRELAGRMEGVRRDYGTYGVQRPTKLLGDIAAIEGDFGDLLDEPQRSELGAIEEALQRGRRPPGLEEVYGPDEVHFLPPRSVTMTFRFGAERAGAWERGAWRADGRGWRPPAGSEALAAPGPTLALEPPLDLAQRMRVVLAFEPLPESAGGPSGPSTVVVSAAGFHAAFVCDLSDRFGPRFLVDTTSADDVLARLRAGANPRFDPLNGFEMDRPFEIELAVHPKGGTLDGVVLAGRELRAQRQFSAPDLAPPGAARVEVRAAGDLRLVRVTLEAKRRPE